MCKVCSKHGRILVGNLKKEIIWEIRHRGKDNIKIGRKEIQYESVDWIRLAQNRNQWRVIVSMVINLLFYKKRGNS
jgi:hypothetical protein